MLKKKQRVDIAAIITDAYNAIVTAWHTDIPFDHCMPFFKLMMLPKNDDDDNVTFKLIKKKNRITDFEVMEAVNTFCALIDTDQRFDNTPIEFIVSTPGRIIGTPDGWLRLSDKFYNRKVHVFAEIICEESRRQCDSVIEKWRRGDHENYEYYSTYCEIVGDRIGDLTFHEILDACVPPCIVLYDAEGNRMNEGFKFYEIRPLLSHDDNLKLNEKCPPGQDFLFESKVQDVLHELNYWPYVVHVMIFACPEDDGILM